jgi:hypothetical protein
MSHLSKLVPLLLLIACRNTWAPSPGQAETVTGTWTGLEGPVKTRLTPTARLEITEVDGGVVYAFWYSSNLFPDAGSWPVGALYGFRDGGTLYLRNTAKLLPDGGLEGGSPFTATLNSPNHLDAVDVRTKLDGGPLPIYLSVDRAP